jgi:hypothetical protein
VPFFLAAALLLALVGTVIVVGLLTWSMVQSFIVASRATRVGDATTKLVKQRLDSGQYSVVAGVFTSSGASIASQRWDATSLDVELDNKFGEESAIWIET